MRERKKQRRKTKIKNGRELKTEIKGYQPKQKEKDSRKTDIKKGERTTFHHLRKNPLLAPLNNPKNVHFLNFLKRFSFCNLTKNFDLFRVRKTLLNNVIITRVLS
jgi:hypothetical protein